jgi:hypothetical protein
MAEIIPSLYNINEVEIQRQGDLAWFKALEKRWVLTGPGRRLQRPQSAVGGATNNNSTPGLVLLPFHFLSALRSAFWTLLTNEFSGRICVVAVVVVEDLNDAQRVDEPIDAQGGR